MGPIKLKMKLKLLLLFLLNASFVFSQQIIVEKVKLIETIDSQFVSEIPRVKDLNNKNSKIVEKINAEILDRFMINSFNQSDLDEFRWHEVECGSELKGDILYIWFKGGYYGPYLSYGEDDFYFSLKTGELLKLTEIPFQSLFSLSGYLDFLNKYWLDGVKKEFATAIKCAELEPYCSYYDIYSYAVEKDKLVIDLIDDCYPHVVMACSPNYRKSIKLDSIKPFLSDLGRYMLIESNYMSKSIIEKFNENILLKPRMPNNLFFFGKIDNKYAFSMAINIDSTKKVTGYYYYDNKREKISLKGQSFNETISLVESHDQKTTGFFELMISKNHNSDGLFIYNYENDYNSKYLTGKWLSTDKKKVLNIKFTELKTNHKY